MMGGILPQTTLRVKVAQWGYENYSNWDTGEVGLALEGNFGYELFDAYQRFMASKPTREQFEQWVIENVIGPYNREREQEAHEWNSIPKHDRLDYGWERLKDESPGAADIVRQINDMFGMPSEDIDDIDLNETTINVNNVNFDELWADAVKEYGLDEGQHTAGADEMWGIAQEHLQNPRAPLWKDSVKCPNCGEDNIKTDVCPVCNKPLSVEWRKRETEQPFFDHPPQGHNTAPEWTFPDRMPKRQPEKTDNQFPSVISHRKTAYYPPGTRLRYIGVDRSLNRNGLREGDLGTFISGADYVPGLDAGQFVVQPDSFPEASPFGHRSIAYWTFDEMSRDWQRYDQEDWNRQDEPGKYFPPYDLTVASVQTDEFWDGVLEWKSGGPSTEEFL